MTYVGPSLTPSMLITYPTSPTWSKPPKILHLSPSTRPPNLMKESISFLRKKSRKRNHPQGKIKRQTERILNREPRPSLNFPSKTRPSQSRRSKEYLMAIAIAKLIVHLMINHLLTSVIWKCFEITTTGFPLNKLKR